MHGTFSTAHTGVARSTSYIVVATIIWITVTRLRFKRRLPTRVRIAASIALSFGSALVSPTVQAQLGIPTGGLTPEHDYVHSSVDSVDLDSGNLIIDIPIVTYKQKGRLPDLALKVRYNSTNWAVTDQYLNIYSPTWLIVSPSEAAVSQNNTNVPYWTFFGMGMQVVRGDALSTGTVDIPITLYSGEPGAYTQTYVEDGSGTQHLMYLQLGTARAMDGSGIGATAADIRSSLTKIIDAQGITHTAVPDSVVASGNLVFANDGFFDTISDPFGNAITPTLTAVPIPNTGLVSQHVDHWTDSVGRTIPAPPGGYTSAASPALTPGCNTYQYPSTASTTAPYTFCYSAVQVSSAFGLSTIADALPQAQVFLSSVQLPNGTAYSFVYDGWGEISQMNLPDGGNIQYGWVTASLGTMSTRVLSSRTLNPGDGTPSRTWTYCLFAGMPTCTYSAGMAVMTDPEGNQTQRYTTYQTGQTSRTTAHYDGPASNNALLDSSTSTYCNTTSVFARVAIPEPQLICQKATTLSDGENATEVTTYDTATTVGDPIANTDSNGVELSSTGVKSIGLPVFKTTSRFSTDGLGLIVQATGTNYLWQTNRSYLQANLLDLPSAVTVADGNNTVFSSTTFGYDESNGSPQGLYGDKTSTTQAIGYGLPSVSTTAVYNSQGMVSDTYDGNVNAGRAGNHVHVAYDATGLFPSSVSQSATNGVNHVDYYSYDANTGNMNAHTDQNGSGAMDPNHTTKWSYDNMGRMTSVLDPLGGGSTFCYTDVGGSTCHHTAAPYTTYVSTRLSATAVMTSSVAYDGLGEPVQTTAPDGAVIATQYDGVGRVKAISNPYIGPGSPNQWTTTTYDGLGRKRLVTQPDSTTLQWQYTGPVIDSWDENNTHTQRTLDSLNRLVKVLELGTTSQPLSLETDYSYDASGNLRSVNQIGRPGYTDPGFADPEISQTRRFNYDWMSRLTQSCNPETSAAGTSCNGTYWSNTYVYDQNGNLLHKTDANDMTISYQYDALNRMTFKSAPDIDNMGAGFYYDQGTNGIGRFTGHSKDGTSGEGYVYDAMGRVTGTSWCKYMPGAGCYGQQGMQVSYDWAGNETQLTYPDGRVIQQQWDSAGRLGSVQDVTPNGSGEVYFSGNTGDASSFADYWPSGALQGVAFGNGVTQSFFLNNRLQPCRSTATSAILPPNPNGGNVYDRQSFFSASASSPCGNEAANNGNIYAIVDNVLPKWTQSFGYDNLNRLTSATRSDGIDSHTYYYDSFGNMLPHDILT